MASKIKNPPKKGQVDQKDLKALKEQMGQKDKKDKKDKKTKRGTLTERKNFNSEKKSPKKSDSPKKVPKKTKTGTNKVTKTSNNRVTKNSKTKNKNATTRYKGMKQSESIGTRMGKLKIHSQGRDVTMGDAEPETPAIEGEKGEEVKMDEEADEEIERDYSKALIPVASLPYEEEPRKTWKIDGPPITDPAKVPEGWDANEYDLDEFDINANIVRNMERIKEGILPHFFETRLIHYMNLKKDQASLKSSAKDVSWSSLVRIDTLKRIAGNLLAHGDPQEQLVNVKALIEAYKNNELQWNPPFVTYWFAGKLYKGPEKLDKKAMSEYWKELGRPKSWWVEGWQGPGPSDSNFEVSIPPRMDDVFMHMVNITVRPADLNQHAKDRGGFVTLSCLDDTGSENMLIYESDISEIQQQTGVVCQDLGHALLNTVTGQIPVRAVLAEVCVSERAVWSEFTQSRWCDVVIFVRPGNPLPGVPRLSGIWIRHIVYSQTRPDNRGLLDLSDRGFLETRGIPYYEPPRGPSIYRIGPSGGGSQDRSYGGRSRIPPPQHTTQYAQHLGGGAPPNTQNLGGGALQNTQNLGDGAPQNTQNLVGAAPDGPPPALPPPPPPPVNKIDWDWEFAERMKRAGLYETGNGPEDNSNTNVGGDDQRRWSNPRRLLDRAIDWFTPPEWQPASSARRRYRARGWRFPTPPPPQVHERAPEPAQAQMPIPQPSQLQEPGVPRAVTPEIPGSLLTAALEAQDAEDRANRANPPGPRPPRQPRYYRQYVTFNDGRVPIEDVQQRIDAGWNPDPPPPLRPAGYVPFMNWVTGEINPIWIQEVEVHYGIRGVFQRMGDWLSDSLDVSNW